MKRKLLNLTAASLLAAAAALAFVAGPEVSSRGSSGHSNESGPSRRSPRLGPGFRGSDQEPPVRRTNSSPAPGFLPAASSGSPALRQAGSAPAREQDPRSRQAPARPPTTSGSSVSRDLPLRGPLTAAISPMRDDSSPPPPALLPAAFIEIDHPGVAAPADQERIAGIASDFSEALDRSGLDPGSLEYRALWDREKSTADARFKALYGSRAWMAHHIRNHHFQSQPSAE